MIAHPFWLVWALVVYLPFEDFLLKWVPVPEAIYAFLRLLSELAVYGLFVLVIGYRFLTRLSFRRTPIDAYLITFVALAVLSTLLNGASLFGGAVTLRTLLRYVALYYVIVNLNIGPSQVKSILFAMLCLAIGESLLGIVQHLVGVSDFWRARSMSVELEGVNVRGLTTGHVELGAALGTFCQSVSMSLYLLIGAIIFLSHYSSPDRPSRHMKSVAAGGLFVVLCGLMVTYSKGSILAALLAIPVTFFVWRRFDLMTKFSVFGSLGLILLISVAWVVGGSGAQFVKAHETYQNPLENFEVLFSSEYVKRTENSRQWVIKEVGGTLLRSVTLFGFSPDETTAREKIVDVSGGTLSKLIAYKGFEDVFWVAMIAYYGFVGVCIFGFMMYNVYKCAIYVMKESDEYICKVLGGSVAVLLIITIPINLIVRAFEFRTFSFYLWLLMALCVSEYLRLRSSGPIHLLKP